MVQRVRIVADASFDVAWRIRKHSSVVATSTQLPNHRHRRDYSTLRVLNGRLTALNNAEDRNAKQNVFI